MKKTNLTIIVGMMMIFLSNSISAQMRDFRNTNWGLDAATVKTLEKNKLTSEETGMLVYDCSLANINGSLTYEFSLTNELMGAIYVLPLESTNMNYDNMVSSFKQFDESLKSKYGIPIVKIATNNTKDQVNINESEWANYLSNGNLVVQRQFKTDKVTVILTLSTIDKKPTIQINYTSEKINKINNEEISNQLKKNL